MYYEIVNLIPLFMNQAILVFGGIFFVWLLGYWYVCRLNLGKEKEFELSIKNLASLSVLLVIYNMYITSRSNEEAERNRLSYNTLMNIQRNWLEPQKELLQNYPEGYFLYASMLQDLDLSITPPENYDISKRKQIEAYYSIRMFQAIEDFLSTGSFDITGRYVWVNNFLMWMQSPILRSQWVKLSFNFSTDTRELVNRIIVESDKLIQLRKEKGKISCADYDKISRNFKVDLR